MANEAMISAADPVNGTAPSFDAERLMRKHIGDYALFVAGMYPEAAGPVAAAAVILDSGAGPRPQRSYFIVSQFNLFEYEHEAPLFGRLSDWSDGGPRPDPGPRRPGKKKALPPPPQ